MELPNRKFTHGICLGSTVRLFYQVGHVRKFIDVPQSRHRYYFLIKKTDFLQHKDMFKCMKRDKEIQGYAPYGDDFVRIYVKNKNLPEFKIEDGETDQKLELLDRLAALGIEDFESDLTSLDRLLIDLRPEIEDDYYKGYFDIETDDRNKEIEIGATRILSMAVVDNYGEVRYLTSGNEGRLLRKMVQTLRRYTMIVGFYSREFDLPYIKARCRYHGIEFDLSDMIHIDLHERIVDLFKFDKEGPSRFSLDALSEHFLNERKMVMPAGFYETWKKYPEVHKQYNIKDVVLLKKLDEHLEAIDTMVLQCKLCGNFINRFWNTRLTDMYLLRLAHGRKVALPTKHERLKIQMPGGRVIREDTGIYDNAYVWDLNQYYSTTMRAFNISPETLRIIDEQDLHKHDTSEMIVSPIYIVIKLMYKLIEEWCEKTGYRVKHSKDWWRIRIKDIDEEAVVALHSWLTVEIQKHITLKSLNILKPFVKTEHCGGDLVFVYKKQVFFLKEPTSLVHEMLETFVQERSVYKDEMKRIDIEHAEDTDLLYRESREYKIAKQYNLAYKLMGNVVFGYMSSHKNRCYSHAIACTITLGCQVIINMIRTGAMEKFGTPAIYGDTDSIFFLLRLGTRKALRKFDRAFNRWFRSFMDENLKYYFNIDEHKYGIEPKLMYHRFLLIGKKNYIGWNRHSKEWEAMGIDYVKRNTIPYAAKLQKKLVRKLILKRSFNDPEKLRRWVLKEADKFFEMAIDDTDIIEQFVIHTRVLKAPDDYANEPVHARIVRKMWTDKDQFFIGDVLRYVIIESDEKLQQGEQIERFLQRDLKLDRNHYWSKLIFSKLKRVLDAVQPDIPWESCNPDDEAKRQKRIERFKKGLSDPKRRDRAYTLMWGMKSMHVSDKKAVTEWARDKGLLEGLEEVGSGED